MAGSEAATGLMGEALASVEAVASGYPEVLVVVSPLEMLWRWR